MDVKECFVECSGEMCLLPERKKVAGESGWMAPYIVFSECGKARLFLLGERVVHGLVVTASKAVDECC